MKRIKRFLNEQTIESKVMSVFLAFVLVFSCVNVQVFAAAGGAASDGEETAATETTDEGTQVQSGDEATQQQDDSSATKGEESVSKQEATEAKDSTETKKGSASGDKKAAATDKEESDDGSDTVEASEGRVTLKMANAYVEYPSGQKVVPPATSFKITLGESFQFKAFADEGYELDSVVLSYNGKESAAEANASGYYVVPASKADTKLTIKVTGKEAKSAEEIDNSGKTVDQNTTIKDDDTKAEGGTNTDTPSNSGDNGATNGSEGTETETSTDTGSGSILDGVTNFFSGLFGGSDESGISTTAEVATVSDAGGTVNAGGSATIYVDETVTLQGTSEVSRWWDAATVKSYKWTSSDTSIAKVDRNGSSDSTEGAAATVTAKKAGTVTITHTYQYRYGNFGSYTTATEPFTVTVLSNVKPTGISITGADSVALASSTQLAAALQPADASGSISWASDNDSVATVDSNGNVTGVALGTATITAYTYDADGNLISATHSVTITNATASTDDAQFYYVVVPGSDPASNTTGWGDTLGNGTVTTKNGTFADGNKNLYGAQGRVVSWPSGAGTANADGTLTLSKDSSHWQTIFNAYKDSVSKTVGVEITEDDVEAIILTPYKVSQNNGTNPDKHVDCTVDVKCKSFATASWYVQDAGASGFAFYDAETVRTGVEVSLDGTTNYKKSEPAASKTSGGKKYVFDGWYTDSACTQKVSFPYTVSGTVNFYGKYIRADLTYTVKYVDEDTNKEIATAKTGAGKSEGATVVENAITINGYKLTSDKTQTLVITTDTDKNVITFKYKAKDGGRIGYNLTKASATCAFPSDIEKDSGDNYKYYYNYKFEKGDTVSVISAEPTATDGSVFIGWLDKDRGSQASAIRSAGETITYIYDSKTDYTLDALWASLVATGGEYTYSGESHSITTSAGINEGTNLDQKYKDQALTHVTLGDTASYRYSTDGGKTWTDWSTANPGFTNVGTYTVQAKQAVNVDGVANELTAQATITIKPAAVTVTANAASKTYGDADPTFTAEVSGLIGNDTVTYTVARTNTDEAVGTYAGVIVPTGDAAQGNYTVTYVPATFTITAKNIETGDKMTVNDPSNSVYDGKNHKWVPTVKDGDTVLKADTDYTVTYDTTDFVDVKTITVTITGKGNYSGTVTKTYQITKAPLTITTESASKVYDGDALTAGGKVEGLVNGEKLEFTVTGSQTDVGSSDNTYSIDWSHTGTTAKESNYEIVKTEIGKLTVTETTDEIVVTTTGGTFTYDGKAHGATVEVTGLPKGYSVQTATSNATATDATTAVVTATADNLVIVNKKGEDVTSKLHIKKVDGSITINPASVTVVTPSATKTYDGTALKAEGTMTGLVNGETALFTTKGSQTEVGSSDNWYTIDWAADGNSYTAKQSNYIVSETKGTLTVTAQSIEGTTIDIDSPSDIVYDGQEHKWAPTVKTSDGSTTLVSGTDYDVAYSTTDFTNVTGTITVTITAKGNYTGTVTRTYKITPRPVTLTSADASKIYDGTALTNGTVTASTGTNEGFVEGEGATYDVTGSQTNVGTSKNTFTYTLNSNTKAANYTITTTEGTLKVTPVTDEVTVTITENSGTAKYDGSEKTASGYTVSIDNSLYTANDFSFSGNATVKGTNAGTYNMELKASDFTNTSSNFSKVTFVIVDGTLTISKRDVTLTSGTSSKVYDGIALTNSNVTVGGDGFVGTQGATYDVTGTITNVGEINNTFTYTLNSNTNADNYNITKTEGKLTVTPVTDEVVVTITGNKVTDKYDGTEKKAEGYAVNSSNALYTAGDFSFSGKAEAKGTNAGTYNMGLAESQFANTSSNFTNVKFVVADGTLTISKRDVTLTSATDTKAYDGKALTNKNVTVGGDGFVKGEGATCDVTGSQTVVGSSNNTFTYELKDGTNADNYNITMSEGTLTVTNRDAKYQITATAASASATYDGTVHSATGITYTGLEIDGVIYKVEGLSSEDPSKTDAGTYTNNITGTAIVKDAANNDVTDQFEVTTVNGSLVINKAPVTVTVEKSVVYNGAEQQVSLTDATPTVTGIVSGEKLTLTAGSITGTNPGDYTTWSVDPACTVAKADNSDSTNNYTYTYTGKLTITKAPADKLSLTVTPYEGTYDGDAHTVAVTTSAYGKDPVTISYSTDNKTWSTTAPTWTDVTTAQTVYVKATNPNYEDATAQGTVTIKPATLTITTPDATKVYDGTALTAAGSISGFVKNETATFKTTGSQTAVGTSDNTYELTFNGTAQETNYTVSATTGKLTVTEQSISDSDAITVDAPENVKYDGAEHKWAPPVTTKDGTTTLVAGTDYEVAYDTTDFVNVKTITVTITGKGNYNGTVTKTYQITPRAVTVAPNYAEKTYDGTPLTASEYTLSGVDGFVKGEGFDSVTYTGSITNVGTETSGIGEYKLQANTNADNYTITTGTNKLVVTAKSITDADAITVGTLEDVVYNGTSQQQKPTVTDKNGNVLVENTDYTVSFTEDTTNVGTVTVTVTGKGNYSGTVERNYKITPASLTITTNSASKVYDGSALTADGSITGFVNNETATFKVTGSQTKVGSSSNTYKLTWDGTAKESNYQITSETLGTLTVTETANEIVVTTTGGEFTYDGQAHGATVAVTGLPTGYTVQTASSNATATDATETVVAATADNLVIVNADGEDVTSKLKITKVDGSITINPRPVTLTSASATKAYDGTALTAQTVTASTGEDQGFIEGQGVESYNVTGSQTVPGSSKNTFSYTLNTNTKASNYRITRVEGDLKVTSTDGAFGEIELVGKSSTDNTYDGAEHSAKGVVTDKFTVKGQEYTVSGYKTSDPAKTDAGTYANEVTGTYKVTDANGNDVTNEFTVTSKDGKLVIGKRSVTLTSATDSKVYDGNALTNGNITVGGDGFVTGEGATYDVTGTITNVGTEDNTFTYTLNEGTKAGNYDITKTEGTLTVSAVTEKVVVTITGKTDAVTYDGTSHEVKSYDVAISNNLYKVSDFSFSGKAEATGTNVGTYKMGLEASQFTNNSSNFSNVEFVVTDGSLVIEPKTVTVTAVDAEKFYGEDDPTFSATVKGLVDGEDASLIKYTVSRPKAGTNEKAGKYADDIVAAGAATQGNYSVTYVPADFTIKVKPVSDTKDITVSDPADTVYNGLEQKQPVTVTDTRTDKTLVEGEDYTIEYTDATDAGTVTVTIKGKGNYGGEVTKTYKINPAPLTIKTASAEKVYDGDALTKTDGYTFNGLVNAETADFKVIGSQTEVGSSTNTYELKWTGSAKSGNYTIDSEELGTLKVTESSDTINVTTTGGTFTYDGQAHGATVAVTNLPKGYSVQTATSSATATDVTTTDVTATADNLVIVNKKGEDVTSKLTINYINGSIKITPATLTITTSDAEKVYDGTALTKEGSISGFVNNETATFATTGTQTEVGTSNNTYSLTWDGTANQSNYTLSESIGKLTVTAQSIVPDDPSYNNVNVGDLNDVVYNGTSQQQKPTVTDKGGNALVENTDYTVSFSEDTTNAGKVTVTITGTGNYSGTVTRTYNITKRQVTVNTNTDSKVYDGTELVGVATVAAPTEATGFVDGEGASFTATTIGAAVTSQTANAITKTEWKEGTKASNYEVVNGNIGTLEITAKSIVPDPGSTTAITINAPSSVKYDGDAHQWSPTVTDPTTGKVLTEGVDYDVTYSTNDFTNVTGTITVTITGKGNYSGEVTKTYEITKRSVTLTSATDSKVYDGEALTNKNVTVGGDGFVEGEGATYDVTGSQTYVGSSDNEFTYTLTNGTLEQNYTITVVKGTLTVTDGTGENPVDPGKVITKTHQTGTFGLGDTVTFTITATNIYAEAKTMTFTEQEGVTITGDVTFTNVEPGAEVTTTATYTIQEKDILAGTFKNTATVSFEGGKSFDGADTVGTEEIDDKNAHLTVTKTTTNNVDKTKVFQVGETIEYSVVVENDGNVTISNVSIDDQLKGVVLASDTGETTLAPGAKRTATYTYTVTQADVDAGKDIVNNATAKGTDPGGDEPTVVPGTTTDTIPAQMAAVSVTKSSVKEDGSRATGLSTGEDAYWTVTLTNKGNVTLKNVRVYELMGIDAASVTDSNGNSIAFTNADAKPTQYRAYKRVANLDSSFELAPGATVTVKYTPYTITEADVVAGSVRNRVYAGGDYTNSAGKTKFVDSSASQSSYTTANAHYTITKTVTNKSEATGKGGKWAEGDTIKYTITVKNDGNLTLKGITVTDALTGNTGDKAFTIESLAIGETKTFDAEYTVTEADVVKGKVVNEATGEGGSPDPKVPDPKPNPGTETEETEDKAPSLKVEKTTTSTMPEGGYKAGDTIDYTITVTNDGNLTVKDITVTDALTGNDASKPLATGVTLAPGAKAEYSASYTVTEADTLKGTEIVNTAVAKGTASDGSTVEKTGEKTDTNVGGTKGIEVTKTVTSTAKDAAKGYTLGETIDYKIVVTNTGSTTVAKGMTVADSLTGDTWTTIDALAPQAKVTYTTSHKVTQTDILAGKVENTATATAKIEADGSTVTDDDTAKVDGSGENGKIEDKNSHITVAKTTTNDNDGARTYKLGEVIEYSITATNDGNLTLTNVTVTDEKTGDTWPIDGAFAPGDTKTFTAKYEVTEADVKAGSVKNVATATGTSPDPDNPKPGVTPGEKEDPTEQANASLSVVKTSAAAADTSKGFVLGETISYTITVTNNGNQTVSDITVTDDLTGNTGDRALATGVTLKPGESKNYTATYTVTEADLIAGTVKNVAKASGKDSDGNTVENTGEKSDTTDKAKADMAITKTTTSTDADNDGKYALGETITYNVNVKNTGNVTLSNVKVSDQLEGAELTSGEGSDTIATLAPGKDADVTYKYVVTEADVIAGKVLNSATASADTPDPVVPKPDPTPGTDEEKTDDAKGSLKVDKATESTPADGKAYAAGETITYKLTATNTGNVTLTNVVVTDELTGDSGANAWNVGTLEPGKSVEKTVSYTVTEADTLKSTTIHNVATATASTPDGVDDPTITPGEKDENNVKGAPSIKVVKGVANAGQGSGPNGAFAEGDTINYTVTVTNTGNVTLSDVSVVDELTGLSKSGDWNVGELAVGETATFTGTYTVTQADIIAKKVVNTAVATGTVKYDPNEDKQKVTDTSTVTTGNGGNGGTIVDPKSHLTVTKTVTNEGTSDKTDANTGKKLFAKDDTIQYKVTVTNDGNLTLTDVKVTDQLAGATLTSGEESIVSLAPGESKDLTYEYKVTEADLVAGSVKNVATATGKTPDPDNPTPGTDDGNTDTPTDAKGGQLNVKKTIENTGTAEGGKFQLGDTVKYKITVQNNGDLTVKNITVTDASLKQSWTVDELAPGADALVYEVETTVTDADIVAGKVANEAVAKGTDTKGKDVEGKDDVSDEPSNKTVDKNGHITITKSVTNKNEATGDDGKWAAGDTIKYSITATNDGTLTMTDITVTDELTGNVDTKAWTVKSLAPGKSETFTAEYKVTEADVIKGKVVNEATGKATSPDPDNPNPTPTPGTEEEETEDKDPSLKVEKTTTSTMPEGGYKAGDTIDYKITVTNNGNLTVKDITVTDELTGNTGDKALATDVTLAPGEKAEYKASYTVTESDTLKGTEIKNTAVAKGTASDGTTVEKTGEKTDTNVKGTKGIDVVKTVTNAGKGSASDGRFALGDVIKYSVSVENTGNTTLTNVTTTDELLGWTGGDAKTIEKLAPGAKAEVYTGEHKVTQNDIIAGSVVNSATATATVPADKSTVSDTDSVTTGEGGNGGDVVDKKSHLKVTKTTTNNNNGERIFKAGETIEYSVVVENDGNMTISNVAIDDQLSGVKLVSDTGETTLVPGATRTATYTYTVTQADVDSSTTQKIVNNATASGTDPEDKIPEVTPGETEDPIPSKEPALTVVKTADKVSDVKAGDTITYTITVTNSGNVTVSDVTVADGLEGATLVSDTGETKLAPNEQRTAVYSYTVTEGDLVNGKVVNTATANGKDPNGNDVNGEGEKTVETEKANAHYTITKTTTSIDANKDGKYAAGETITYNVNVKNDGNVTLSNVKITDQLAGAKLTSDEGSDTIEKLAPGEEANVTYEYVVTEADVIAGSVVNTATGTAESPDPDNPNPTPTPGTDEEKTDDAKGHITVTKTTTSEPANGKAYLQGETVSYQITATNDGNLTLTDVTVSDQLTKDNWTIASLAPGASQTFTATYKVKKADAEAGTLVNVATATGTSPDPDNPKPGVTPGTKTVDTDTTPTTPTTPSNNGGDNDGTDPEPIRTIVNTLRTGGEAIDRVVNPNEPAEEVIDDNGTPLAPGDEDIACWVHYYIILGILITLIYGAGVVIRRVRYGSKIKDYDDDVMGKNDPDPTPVGAPVAQPGTAGMEA